MASDRHAFSDNATLVDSLTLEADLAELNRLSPWIAGLAENLALTPRTAFRLELALTEAVTNVLQYGLGDAAGGFVQVTAAVVPEGLALTVSDPGPPFDPLQVAPPDAPDSLEDAMVGGLGIHLLRQYADACVYVYRDGRNELTLTFNFTGERPANGTT
jgi:anti-sigma regulatory factor (Ser/Thr protein kinase)